LNNIETSITPAKISQPLGVQMSVATSQTPVDDLAIAHSTSEQSNVPSHSVSAGISQTSTPQQASVQSDNTPAQRPSTKPTTTPAAAKFETAQPSLNVTATTTTETESTAAPAEIAQPAIVQSTITSAQAPSLQPVAAQVTVPVESLQPSQNTKATEPVETHSSISTTNLPQKSVLPAGVSQTNLSVETLTEAVLTPSSVAALAKDADLSSTDQAEVQFSAPQIQDRTAPVTVSAKSGDADASAAAVTAPDASPAAVNSGNQDSPSAPDVNSNSIAVQSVVENVVAAMVPAPVLHEAAIASVDNTAVPALNAGQIAKVDAQPVANDQKSATNTITVPSGVADQQVVQPVAASIGATHASIASLKPVSAAKPQANASATAKSANAEPASTKKIAQPGSESGSKTGSQDTSSKQSQNGDNPQTQIAAPVPVDIAVHPAAAIAAAENSAHVAANHTASTSADTAKSAATTTGNSISHASVALPQAAPVINTARLIQNMGQTEMRVGMRSNEFGNISISTSATRDQVSAQISVEHGELAKTLTAHLPEMQARLGSSQPMDVRIDMNGAATGQGTSNFGGTHNDTAGQSRGGRQQAGSMAAGQSGNVVVEKQFSPVVAAAPSGYARLDIRV
jgi:hypothetical protein